MKYLVECYSAYFCGTHDFQFTNKAEAMKFAYRAVKNNDFKSAYVISLFGSDVSGKYQERNVLAGWRHDNNAPFNVYRVEI